MGNATASIKRAFTALFVGGVAILVLFGAAAAMLIQWALR